MSNQHASASRSKIDKKGRRSPAPTGYEDGRESVASLLS